MMSECVGWKVNPSTSMARLPVFPLLIPKRTRVERMDSSWWRNRGSAGHCEVTSLSLLFCDDDMNNCWPQEKISHVTQYNGKTTLTHDCSECECVCACVCVCVCVVTFSTDGRLAVQSCSWSRGVPCSSPSPLLRYLWWEGQVCSRWSPQATAYPPQLDTPAGGRDPWSYTYFTSVATCTVALVWSFERDSDKKQEMSDQL